MKNGKMWPAVTGSVAAEEGWATRGSGLAPDRLFHRRVDQVRPDAGAWAARRSDGRGPGHPGNDEGHHFRAWRNPAARSSWSAIPRAEPSGKPRLMIQTYPASRTWSSRLRAALEGIARHPDDGTAARHRCPAGPCHQRRTLDAGRCPEDETTGFASWYATSGWRSRSLCGPSAACWACDRFFSVPDNETLEAMLAESATEPAGSHRPAWLSGPPGRRGPDPSLDQADQDHGRELLADVPETDLYEAALTVMMRLVFLFCAEERELLLLGDDLYDQTTPSPRSGPSCGKPPTSTAKKFWSGGTMPGSGCWPPSGPSTAASSTTGSSCRPTAARSSTPTGSRSSKAASRARPGRTRPPIRCRWITARCCTCSKRSNTFR